jgi:hypothetical protein
MGQNRELSRFPNAITVLDNGNVGMGTSSPNSILEIKTSTATNSIRLGVIADDNRFNMISLNGVNTEGNYIGLAGGGSTDTNLFYQSGNAGSHIFRTGNGSSFTERMRILSTGNVGIGTSSPFAGATSLTGLAISDRGGLFKLAVNDVMYLSNNLYYDGTNWKRIVAGGGTFMQLESVDGGTLRVFAAATGTAGSNATTVDRLMINSSGNVGIGTGSINTNVKVKIKASSEGTGIGLSSSTLCIARVATDTQLNIGYYSTPDAWVISSSYGADGAYKPIVFATSDAERMRISTNGQLSLGTYHEQVKFCPGADSNHYLTYNSSADGLELSGYSSVVFSTLGGTERARFNTNGVFTIPNQPAFSVYKTGVNNRSGIMTYSTTILNRGNCVNLSNGRFTAPVGGAYQISFMAFQQTGTSGILTIVLYRNGANTLIRTYQDDPNTGYGPHATISVVMSLNANDYIEVRVDAGDIHGNEDGYFSGFLIG